MIELAVSFLLAVIFTIVLSFGYGKKLTETHAGRPVLGALGFLIVIAGYSWSKRDFDLFGELVFWFIIVCLPVLVGGVINALFEGERVKANHEMQLDALRAELVAERAQAAQAALDKELEVYSIKHNDRT